MSYSSHARGQACRDLEGYEHEGRVQFGKQSGANKDRVYYTILTGV